MNELRISLWKRVPFTFTTRLHFLLKRAIPCKNYKAKYKTYAFSAQPAPLMAMSPE